MQKIFKFLEGNVEWVAIGLAALFLGWTIYGYVIQKPVVSAVGTSQLTPGEIDQKIADGPETRLRGAMQNSQAPDIHVNDFVTPLQQQLSTPPDLTPLAGPWSGIPLPANLIDTAPKLAVVANAVLVTALPDPAPAPINVLFSQGRSNVTVPDPAAAPATGGAAPTGGAPADRNWVTVAAIVPVKQIAAAFDAKKIPAQLSSTTILRVELIRQELDSSNSWGPETPIAPLFNVQLMSLPPKNAPLGDQNIYIPWAETNQLNLLQPPFYTVLQADPWYAPGTTPPAPAAIAAPPPVEPAIDPAKQKELERLAKQKALQDARKAAQQQSHPPTPRPPTGSGGYHPDVFDGGRTMELAQAYPPQGAFGGTPSVYPPPYPQPNQAGTSAGPLTAGQPGAAGAIPNPSTFDPHQQADVTIWAHDDSIVPGHTYRYCLRYTIVNPVRSSANAAAPGLADIFSITSDPSAWTPSISVKSETNVYAITTPPGRESVKFEIFRWKNGAWQSQVFDTEPGDTVGGPRGAGDAKIDFSTGLTLVAVKPDPRNPENRIILLTGDNGKLSRHDLNADRNSEDYKKLKEQTAPKPGTETPQAAAAP